LIQLPQRRKFASRDEFAAAVIATFQELFAEYEAAPVASFVPDWAQGGGVYNVALPLEVVRGQGAAAHGISSIVKRSIEMGKTAIGRLARLERDGQWIVFFEAK
jgi:hypothetical protein